MTTLEPILVVNEIYQALQGESSYAGAPCAMVRLSGCPLRCAWCDSTYAYGDGVAKSLSSIVDSIDAYGLGVVEITGGEPLAQPHTIELLHALADPARGQVVLLETGGSQPITNVPIGVVVIMDLKCPGSMVEASNWWPNVDELIERRNARSFMSSPPNDEVKFVITNRSDYEWARRVISTRLPSCVNVLLSPVMTCPTSNAPVESLDPRELSQWMLEDQWGPTVRLNLQQHKIVWGNERRGV